MIRPEDLEAFIDTRLAEMLKRPLMYAPPQGLESEGLLFIEIYVGFCKKVDFDLMEDFQSFKKALYPQCPSAMTLSQWFTDTKWGCADPFVDERTIGHNAACKIVEFFIAWKADIKNGTT